MSSLRPEIVRPKIKLYSVLFLHSDIHLKNILN